MGLLDQVKRMAGSPLAQGLLAGAAVGSAPFGLLMAPAISAVRAGAERDKTAAEMALEERALQLQAMRRQEEALGQLPGLLGPAMAQPVADSLMGPPAPGQERATDVMNAQQGLLGVMTQIAPEQMAQGILGQMFQKPAKPTAFQQNVISAMGEFTPEAIREYNRLTEDPGEATARAQALADLERARIDLERSRAELEREDDEDRLARARREQAANSVLSSGKTILSSVDMLEGTLLEPGTLGIEGWKMFRQGESLFNRLRGREDLSQAQQAEIAALDNFDSAAADMVVNLALSAGLTSATALNLYTDAKAGIDDQPGSIRRVITKAMRGVLAEADATGAKVPDREKINKLLESIESSRESSAAPAEFDYDPASGRFVPRA